MYTKAGFILNLDVYSQTLQGVVSAFSLTFIRNQNILLYTWSIYRMRIYIYIYMHFTLYNIVCTVHCTRYDTGTASVKEKAFGMRKRESFLHIVPIGWLQYSLSINRYSVKSFAFNALKL